jgi:hypothetical protein
MHERSKPTDHLPFPKGHLSIQIISNRALQPRRALPEDLCQILNIITSSNPKLPNKVLCRRLQIAIIFRHTLFIFSTKVGVRGDGCRAFEALQTGLGFGLGCGIEGAFAEEFVG